MKGKGNSKGKDEGKGKSEGWDEGGDEGEGEGIGKLKRGRPPKDKSDVLAAIFVGVMPRILLNATNSGARNRGGGILSSDPVFAMFPLLNAALCASAVRRDPPVNTAAQLDYLRFWVFHTDTRFCPQL